MQSSSNATTDRNEDWILLVVTLYMIACAVWTLSYHLSLLLKLPAIAIWNEVGVLFSISLFVFRKELLPLFKLPDGCNRLMFGVFAFAIFFSASGLFFAIFNPDDVQFFHRALVQLSQLSEPFIRGETLHNLTGLPALSDAHLLASHELMVAMSANVFGLDPLWAYQKLGGMFGQFLLVLVYVLLYRQLGLSTTRALLATCVVCLFFFMDLRLTGRSFGNIVLFLYNGKVLLWGVWIPLILLFALRYLASPNTARLGLLGLSGFGAVGHSGSGIFMVPALLAGISIAHCLSRGVTRPRIKEALLVNVGSSCSLIILVALLASVVKSPEDITAWTAGWPSNWADNLALVTNKPVILLRDLALLLVAPLLGLSFYSGRFVVALSLSMLLIFANPLSGALWIKIVTPGAYWRLLFLLPVPLCAGLLVECCNGVLSSVPRKPSQMGLLLLLIGLVLGSHFTARNGLESMAELIKLSAPKEYRFSNTEQQFAMLVNSKLEGRKILAAESIMPTLALLNPRLRFEAGRGTRHYFANANRKEEGEQRAAALSLVSRCTTSQAAALHSSLERGVDAIIMGPCFPQHRKAIKQILGESEGHWDEAASQNGYTLLLRRP